MTSKIFPHVPSDLPQGQLLDSDKEVLKRSELFADCSEKDIDAISRISSIQHIPHSGMLIQAGESNLFVFVVVEGQLATYRDSGLSVLLKKIPPGGVVGETAVLAEDASMTFVAAQWPSRLIAIPALNLMQYTAIQPMLARNLLKIMSDRVKQMGPGAGLGTSPSHMTIHNAITGVHNRRWMSDVYEMELAKLRDLEKDAVLMTIDIDHFFELNKKLTRVSGDIVLRSVAEIITSSLAEGDFCAHLTVDQFVALVFDKDLPYVAGLADKIRQQIEMKHFHLPGGVSARITVSSAVVLTRQEDLDSVLARLLARLGEAKQEGGNRIKIEEQPVAAS